MRGAEGAFPHDFLVSTTKVERGQAVAVSRFTKVKYGTEMEAAVVVLSKKSTTKQREAKKMKQLLIGILIGAAVSSFAFMPKDPEINSRHTFLPDRYWVERIGGDAYDPETIIEYLEADLDACEDAWHTDLFECRQKCGEMMAESLLEIDDFEEKLMAVQQNLDKCEGYYEMCVSALD